MLLIVSGFMMAFAILTILAELANLNDYRDE